MDRRQLLFILSLFLFIYLLCFYHGNTVAAQTHHCINSSVCLEEARDYVFKEEMIFSKCPSEHWVSQQNELEVKEAATLN